MDPQKGSGLLEQKLFSVYSWTVKDCYTIVWFRSEKSFTHGAQRQQKPCSQIFKSIIKSKKQHVLEPK